MFSIVVPVYNVEPFLRQCLDSLICQTYDDKEIIIVDDGSTDGCAEICDEFASAYDGVSVIHQNNQGLSAARNAGMANARGEWIVFADSDDWVEPDFLELLQAHILASKTDLCHVSYDVVNELGDDINEKNTENNDLIYSFPNEKQRFDFYFEIMMQTVRVWGSAYRRNIIEEYGLQFVDTEKVYSEDLLFNFQYILHARSVVYAKDVLYYYRKREGSLTDITGFEKRLIRTEYLAEIAYDTVLTEDLPLFRSDFYRIYFKMMNRIIQRDAAGLSDEKVRQVLDLLNSREFHRNCMEQIRGDANSLRKYTKGRLWYRETFGASKSVRKQEILQKLKNEARKNQLIWQLYFLYKNTRYALKGITSFPPVFLRDTEHRVAYLSMSKAACSSISVSMLRRDDIPDDYTIFIIRKPYCSNVPVTEEGWFTFTFVRNPFARLVSCYESKFHTDPLMNKNALRRKSLDFDNYLHGYMKRDEGFPAFINQVVSIPWRLDNNHFCIQYRKITDENGNLLVDYIGKFENLSEEYEPIREKYDFAPLRTYNKSKHGDWRDYYTTDLAKKVYRKYKKDVQYFGYEQEYRDLLSYCRQKEM